jgi:hypothetical protein
MKKARRRVNLEYCQILWEELYFERFRYVLT